MRVLLIVILILLILLLMPLRLTIDYGETLIIRLKYLFLTFTLFPAKPKKKKPSSKKKAEEKNKETSADKEQKNQPKKKSRFAALKDKYGLDGLIELIKEIVHIVVDVLKGFAKHMMIQNIVINAVIAGEDSADTALKYGYACSVIYPALSILDSNCKLKKHSEDISAGFLAEKCVIEFHMLVKMKVIFVLGILLSALFRLVLTLTRHQ